MKMNNISGIVFYVRDLDAAADFYETLGFTIDEKDDTKLSIRLNDFWMDFHPQDKEDKPDFQREANLEQKGAGEFLYVSVEDVDETYQFIVGKGLRPSSEPRDWPWGNREFVIRDPDGYKLVFFAKSGNL